MAKDKTINWTMRAKAIAQIRDALATLMYADGGFHEDEAGVALAALDWLEENTDVRL